MARSRRRGSRSDVVGRERSGRGRALRGPPTTCEVTTVACGQQHQGQRDDRLRAVRGSPAVSSCLLAGRRLEPGRAPDRVLDEVVRRDRQRRGQAEHPHDIRRAVQREERGDEDHGREVPQIERVGDVAEVARRRVGQGNRQGARARPPGTTTAVASTGSAAGGPGTRRRDGRRTGGDHSPEAEPGRTVRRARATALKGRRPPPRGAEPSSPRPVDGVKYARVGGRAPATARRRTTARRRRRPRAPGLLHGAPRRASRAPSPRPDQVELLLHPQ